VTASAWKLVPVEPSEEMVSWGAASLDHPSVFMGGPSRQNQKRAADAYRAMLAAAPEPPPAESGWRDIASAPLDRTPILVAVPAKDGGFIVGEAYYFPESDGSGEGWWWAGTSPGEYYDSPIIELNVGDPAFWMPLPPPPTRSGR
jgi:hypothetical protein